MILTGGLISVLAAAAFAQKYVISHTDPGQWSAT